MHQIQVKKKTDPFRESLDYFLVVVFCKGRSTNFGFAFNIAEGADKFAIVEINNKETYFACFSHSPDNIGRAAAFLDYAIDWKGVQVFSKGKLLRNSHHIMAVLHCYMDSRSCVDTAAHCHRIVDDPNYQQKAQENIASFSIKMVENKYTEKITIDSYLFPCNYLVDRFEFQKNHASSLENQIQAAAVANSCDWCPNFNHKNWAKVGSREAIVDFFD